MNASAVEARATEEARVTLAAPQERRATRIALDVLVPLAAFSVYWLSAIHLAADDQVHLFGADTSLYMELAKGNVLAKLGSNYAIDRITRFHPLTTAMAVAWLKALQPVTPWLSPELILKALFSAVGAVGVSAATAAFAAVAPLRQARLWGLIYAFSLGVWYFSSVEECKIVTATLASLYIAVYLRLRKRWTATGGMLLTIILLLACLNEIVAAFLVAIPAVDKLVQSGWTWRYVRWVACHSLVATAAFVFLELAVKPNTRGAMLAGPEGEGASHFSMLAFYIAQNNFSLESIHTFLTNWLFFNIAAPTVQTTLAPPAWPEYTGYFEPAFLNYFSSPFSALLVVLLGLVLAAGLWQQGHRRDRGEIAILLGLAAYALLRAAFYFIVNPEESILYASGVTLAHLLLIAAPFATSAAPFKSSMLAACLVLLVVVNGAFIIGP